MRYLEVNIDDSKKQIQRAPDDDAAVTKAKHFHGEKYFEGTEPIDDAIYEDNLPDARVTNIAGEMKGLDDLNLDYMNDTELVDQDDVVVNDSASEETDGTEVLSDSDIVSLSENLPEREIGLIDHTSLEVCHQKDGKQILEESHITLSKRSSPEYSRRGFNSVDSDCLRTSGPAGLNMAINGAQGVSSTAAIMQCPDKLAGLSKVSHGDVTVVEEDIKKNNPEKLNETFTENTTRKSFTVDTHVEEDDPLDVSDTGCGLNFTQKPICDNDVMSLSYIDSQEPGESTQNYALDFVDKFIEFNVTDIDQDARHAKSSKSNITSCSKGPQSLAKMTSHRAVHSGTIVYDWDDKLEDEGGGDLFRRRKEDFFNIDISPKKCFTCPGKSISIPVESRISDRTKSTKRQSGINNRIGGLVHSDSKIANRSLKQDGKGVAVGGTRKNLMTELDKEFEPVSTSRRLETADNNASGLDLLNAGLDTQLAAEAMESLRDGVGIDRRSASDSLGRSIIPEVSVKSNGKKARESSSNRASQRKRKEPSYSEDNVRRPKRKKEINAASITSSAQIFSKKPKEQSVSEELKSQKKKMKLNNEMDKTGDTKLPKNTQQRTERISGKNQLEASGKRKSLLQHSKVSNVKIDQGMYTSNSIASRTRQKITMNQIKINEKVRLSEEDCSSKKKASGSRHTFQKVKSFKEQSPDSFYSIEKRLGVSPPSNRSIGGENIDHHHVKLSNSKPNSPKNAHDADVNRHPRRKRIYQNLDNRAYETGDEAEQDKKRSEGIVPVCFNENKHLHVEKNSNSELSPSERFQPFNSARSTPACCITPRSESSPICMGNEYFKQSCKKNLMRTFSARELKSLTDTSPASAPAFKSLRKRKDMSSVRVLFSHHLDQDKIKHQKKILARLGAAAVSIISDATHFVTDHFVRTRNMLEAIASGKPVVTHLWLESCAQASCFIDEKNYILRDAKKEKEFGFSMVTSLARASQSPLLQGLRVLITPNTMPGREIITSLVKAVGGQVVERLGRSALKADRIPDDLIVISCDDYELCMPFLEKGASVYSSELVLNGIVIQRLEYEKHRLFVDQVKRTRSTLWLKSSSNNFLPVSKKK